MLVTSQIQTHLRMIIVIFCVSTMFLDIIHSGESLSVKDDVKMPVQGTCTKCGYISSQPLCKACVLLEGLNRGLPRLGIGKSNKTKVLFDV